MKEIINSFGSELIDTRSSKGDVISYQINSSVPETDDIKIFLDMVRQDPIINAAFDATVDVLSYNGWDFIPLKSTKTEEALRLKQRFENEFKFSEMIDNWVYSLLYYGDSYMELVRDDYNQITELHILESTEISMDYDIHGNVNRYIQNPKQQSQVTWNPESIIHTSLKKIGSNVYSYRPLEPIAREYVTNIFARDYLKNSFRFCPPKMVYSIDTTNKTSQQAFKENLRAAKTNPAIDLLGYGKVDVKELGIPIRKEMLDVLDMLRSHMLAITRVPPLWLGFVGDSQNRGNAEAEIFGFETRIKKLQRILEIAINSELLVKFGIKNIIFKFNPFSLKDEKSIFENAERMIKIGINKKKVAEYMTIRGVTVLESDITEPTQHDNDLDPSRRRMDKSVDNMNSEIESKGVSEKGGNKLKEKGMMVRSGDDEYIDQYGEYKNGK